MQNFWQKLKKRDRPILALAPMAGITDSPFRQICRSFGADVVYSEMASAAALTRAPAKTLTMLKNRRSERPYVIQLFGSEPRELGAAARVLARANLAADGLDLNLGCPVPKIIKQGAGAALFQNLKKTKAALLAIMDNTGWPVSAKIRIQAGRVSALDFLSAVSDLPLTAVMIHGRGLARVMSGPVDAALIKEARNYFPGIILANGGVGDWTSAKALLKASQADGLGIARGALGRPWLFKELKKERKEKIVWPVVCSIIMKHARLVDKSGGSFQEFRKHLLWYAAGWPNAKKLKSRLMEVGGLKDLKIIIENKV